MAQINESIVKLNSTGKVAFGSISTLANNLQLLQSIKDSKNFHQNTADYSTIQNGYATAAKHMEQLWEAIDEEVLAGAVLVPLLPDPASKFASSGNVNPTAGALYSVPQLLSTFIGKDEQNITYQPGSLLFHDNATDKEKILAHNEAIDNILDQLQDTLEDAKEASRLRKRSEEARALAMKKQKL